MRHVWRQPCRTPSNVFFILPLGDIVTCQSYLEPLIISRKTLTQNHIDIYNKNTPKPVYHAKIVKSNQKKRKQLDKLEKDIESSVLASNRKKKISYEREIKSFEQQQEAQTLEQQEEARSFQQRQEALNLHRN